MFFKAIKNLLIIAAFFSINALALDNYNPANNQLTINQVAVGSVTYSNVVITVGKVISIGTTPSNLTYDTYDAATGQLSVSSVLVGGSTYNNVVVTVGSIISIGGQVVLTQSGNPTQYFLNSGLYTSTTGNYSTNQGASFSFTTATPLKPNLSSADISASISTINYDDSLSAGTLDNSSIVPGVGPTVLASTDTNGSITNLQLSVVSPQAPHKSGMAINNLQITYTNGNLTLNASNNSICSSVASNGFCSSSANPQSTALAVSAQKFNLNVFPAYSQIFVFGDSDNDSGRRLVIQGIPVAPYWQGRHSNGPVAVEYMASNIGIQSSKMTNYAVGGAYTGRGNSDRSAVLAKTGMLDQFDTFSETLGNNQADPNALYFIKGGTNDFTSCGNAACTSDQIASFNTNINTLIRTLAAKGAKHFYLSGIYGGIPIPFNSQLLTDAKLLSTSLGVDIVFFDHAAFYRSSSVIPNTNGFSKLNPSACYTGSMYGIGGTLCADVWTYTTWDPIGHYSTRFARLNGNSMSNQIILKK